MFTDAFRKQARLREIREEAKRRDSAHRERRRLRIQQLLADPAKQKYAALVERGEEWSDAKIAYHEDRNLTATCPHLRHIEHGMRMAGIATMLVDRVWADGRPSLEITAPCWVNGIALGEQFELSSAVSYVAGLDSERAPNDNPWARVVCSLCDSRIVVLHPEGPGPANAWFPHPPAKPARNV